MENIVNFDLAILLKEKEFNSPTIFAYCERGGWNKYKQIKVPIHYILKTDGNPFGEHYVGKNWNECPTNTKNKIKCSAPTIAEVIMWLYKKHGIWIQVSITRYGIFYCNILKKENTRSLDTPISWEMQVQLNDYNSPKEAYEEAIKYTLNNLL